ncbi:hypothetical protein Hanom_Chr06g00525971 [Helianthus anomalus]
MPQASIGPKDTVGDIYYKTYTEEARGDAPHQAPWGLKQKDMFLEFGACRDWFLNSFPLGEVNRQRARNHDGLYHAYITDLESQTATLTKKVEDLEADKERIEAELKAQVASKDKDLRAKDVEIAELKRCLLEQTDKNESLEIDLEAERVKAANAEEAKKKAEEA